MPILIGVSMPASPTEVHHLHQSLSALLNEDVEHNAGLIHGAPKIVLHAPDPDEHLVQVPPALRAVAIGGAGGWQSSGRISRTSAE